ncbi:MAG: FAD-dependent oxidoreductase, partial [Bacteroidales bacterium]|nr:FAD-dependent oxidoreductase [Bacteroidales bacterium]
MHIIIIGAGPGGYETAVEAAKKGIEVTLVSEGPVGGTCLNEGCIPTKTLWKSASLLEEMRRAAEFGISAGTPATDAEDAAATPSIDLEKAMERKEAVTAQLRAGIEFLLKNKLIRLVRGHASFKAAEKGVCVTVCGAEGECEEICADKAIIASGSTPATLPVEGKDLP